jgi:hypothetical protein
MPPAPRHAGRISRREALALGAGAGLLAFGRGALDAPRALAAPRTLALTVPPDAFGPGARTAVLAAPGRFVLLGLRDVRGLGTGLHVRARRRGGRWSPWLRVPRHAHAPDPAGLPATGDPLWTGEADELELRADRRPRRPVALALVAVPRAAGALLAARAAAAAPEGRGAQLGGRPPIVLRAAWGGDLVPPRSAPAYGAVQVAVVHHTESSNAYTPAQAATQVLAIARFHRDTRRWNDVGYNFLVDRYGTIYEGRAGGVELPVIGAHAQGFNGLTTGISVLGSFMDQQAPQAAVDAVARLIAWKLPVHGAPVSGAAAVVSGGGSLSRFPSGARVTLERISGHRDVGSTDCPGTRFYAQLPEIRRRALAGAGPPVVLPEVTLDASGPVVYGRPVRLEGSVLAPDKTPQPGVAVRIEKQGPGGSWVTIARTATSQDGFFAASVAWTRGGLVRAVAREVISLPVAVALVPALAVAADSRVVPVGGTVTLSGRMRPPGTLRVVVQRRVRGRWVRAAVRTRQVRGDFTLPVRLPRRSGSYRLLVSAGSGGRVASARPIAVRVAPFAGA